MICPKAFLSAPLLLLVSLCLAEEKSIEETDGEVLVIKLTDFKMKPSKSISNPEDVFMFDEGAERLCFYTGLAAEAKFKMKGDGEFVVVIAAAGDSAMDVKPKFKLEIDDKEIGKETSLKSDAVKSYRIHVKLKAGEHKLSVAFTNDIYKEGEYDSNLYLHGVKITPHRPELTGKEPK
jgi:hypothetical protein